MTAVVFVLRVMYYDIHHLLIHVFYPTQPLGTNHHATCGSPINVIHHTLISYRAGDGAGVERLLQNRSRCQSSAIIESEITQSSVISGRQGFGVGVETGAAGAGPYFLKPETEPPENFT